MSSGNAAFAFAAALLDELARHGVEHLCLCPGSRSAPLAVAASQTPGLRVWTHVDERAAAFFGLGIARATRRPVALVCTSGTAAANFAPAVAEAHYARVPLIALTADRPAELRDVGAGQTITQTGLYGAHTRLFLEAPIPEPNETLLVHARTLAARAAAAACGPPAGTAHLNLPFREPLHPAPVDAAALEAVEAARPEAVSGRPERRAFVAMETPQRGPSAATVDRIVRRIRDTERGVIVCGPLDAEPALADGLARLARAARWPLLADALSGVRSGSHVKEAPLLAGYDALLRDEALAARLDADFVLRFGDTPTSKATRLWLGRRHAAEQVLVDPDGAWHDPDAAASRVLGADPHALVDRLLDALADDPLRRPSGPWLEGWTDAEQRAQAASESIVAQQRALFEPHAVRVLADALPDGATLFVSSSMPVRDVDGFVPVSQKRLRVLANRGANGIDGVTSSALGAAAAQDEPTALLIGDLALLHDLGGLLGAARHALRVPIVVFQNDGGGIFSYLPIAEYGDRVAFEQSFRVPTGVRVRDVARLFDLGYELADDAVSLREAFVAALGARRTTLIEVPVDRDASVAHHRALWRSMAAAARRDTTS